MAGEVILSVAAKEILTNLVSRATEEIGTAWGMKGDLKELEKKLERIQAMLCDAEGRQLERDESVRLWLKELKRAAYEAEDVLDEFAFETLRRKLELQNRMKNKVYNFFSLSNPFAFRFKMAHKLKNVNMMLDDIYREANDLKLDPLRSMNVTAHDHGQTRLTHPFVDDSKIMGRETDVLKVVDKLTCSNDEEDISVVAIVGMAGLGKTTLAQLVYKNEMIMRHISNERMWVCVSDNFDVERLLKEMVESLTGESCQMSNIQGMVTKLQEKLEGKKFLLVLDDVWNKNGEKWDRMRDSLLGIGASAGSKITVTTRSEEVASLMHTMLTHHLERLSFDDGLLIFEQRGFASV